MPNAKMSRTSDDYRHPADHPDGRAFASVINQDFDDSTPQLVYADWLDENGWPDHAAEMRKFAEGESVHAGRIRESGIAFDPHVRVYPAWHDHRLQESMVEPHFEPEMPSWFDVVRHEYDAVGNVWDVEDDSDPVGHVAHHAGILHPGEGDGTLSVPISHLSWRSKRHPDEPVHARV